MTEACIDPSAEYIGCMKIRNVADTRFANPEDKWYDPHNLIFVGDDSRYAEGPFYAVQGHIISGILRSGLVPRLGGPEGAALAQDCSLPLAVRCPRSFHHLQVKTGCLN